MTEQRESTRGLVPWPGPVIPTPEQIEQAAAILGITGVSLWNMLFGPPPVPPGPPPPPPPTVPGPMAGDSLFGGPGWHDTLHGSGPSLAAAGAPADLAPMTLCGQPCPRCGPVREAAAVLLFAADLVRDQVVGGESAVRVLSRAGDCVRGALWSQP